MGGTVSSGRSNDELIDNLKDADYFKNPLEERIMRAVDRGLYFPSNSPAKTVYHDMAWKVDNLHLSAPCIYCDVLNLLELKTDLSFLNLGSGTGYLSTMVGLAIGSNGVNHGVEIYPEVVDFAYEKLEKFMVTSSIDEFDFCEPIFVKGNCLNLAADCRQYDRVYCGAAVPESKETYMKNLLKIGGILVMPYNQYLVQIKRLSFAKWDTKRYIAVSFSPLVETCKLYDGDGPIKLPDLYPKDLKDICRLKIRKILREAIYKESSRAQPDDKPGSSKQMEISSSEEDNNSSENSSEVDDNDSIYSRMSSSSSSSTSSSDDDDDDDFHVAPKASSKHYTNLNMKKDKTKSNGDKQFCSAPKIKFKYLKEIENYVKNKDQKHKKKLKLYQHDTIVDLHKDETMTELSNENNEENVDDFQKDYDKPCTSAQAVKDENNLTTNENKRKCTNDFESNQEQGKMYRKYFKSLPIELEEDSLVEHLCRQPVLVIVKNGSIEDICENNKEKEDETKNDESKDELKSNEAVISNSESINDDNPFVQIESNKMSDETIENHETNQRVHNETGLNVENLVTNVILDDGIGENDKTNVIDDDGTGLKTKPIQYSTENKQLNYDLIENKQKPLNDECNANIKIDDSQLVIHQIENEIDCDNNEFNRELSGKIDKSVKNVNNKLNDDNIEVIKTVDDDTSEIKNDKKLDTNGTNDNESVNDINRVEEISSQTEIIEGDEVNKNTKHFQEESNSRNIMLKEEHDNIVDEITTQILSEIDDSDEIVKNIENRDSDNDINNVTTEALNDERIDLRNRDENDELVRNIRNVLEKMNSGSGTRKIRYCREGVRNQKKNDEIANINNRMEKIENTFFSDSDLTTEQSQTESDEIMKDVSKPMDDDDDEIENVINSMDTSDVESGVIDDADTQNKREYGRLATFYSKKRCNKKKRNEHAKTIENRKQFSEKMKQKIQNLPLPLILMKYLNYYREF